jgi:hypothetical protein
MKTDSILWLLPVVFMLHDFEEILMGRPWLQQNAGILKARFPWLAKRLLPRVTDLSTNGFALAVAEEFLILSVMTLLAVEWELYALWAGMLLAFLFHLVVHLAQFLVMRRYVPVILTSGPAAIYCIWALVEIHRRGLLDWGQAGIWAAASLGILGLNLVFAHMLADRFDRWLARSFR